MGKGYGQVHTSAELHNVVCRSRRGSSDIARHYLLEFARKVLNLCQCFVNLWQCLSISASASDVSSTNFGATLSGTIIIALDIDITIKTRSAVHVGIPCHWGKKLAHHMDLLMVNMLVALSSSHLQ